MSPFEPFDRARAAVEEVRLVRYGMAGTRAGEIVESDGERYRVAGVRRRWPSPADRQAWDVGPGDYIETRLLEPVS